jgi:hypothetical protein
MQEKVTYIVEDLAIGEKCSTMQLSSPFPYNESSRIKGLANNLDSLLYILVGSLFCHLPDAHPGGSSFAA